MSHARFLQWAGALVVIGVVVVICAFKIADYDVWWHIKAGEIMLQTGSMITLDPFAHTREGLPYLALHEWLAQIILSLVWRFGGSTGVILLRTVLVAAVAFLLLQIDRRRAWLNVPLVLLALAAAQRGFVDRPQLFTYVLFAAQILLMLRYLNLLDHTPSRRAREGALLGTMVGLQVLWVNLHGGAVLLGLLLYAAFAAQRILDLWRQNRFAGSADRREIALLFLAGIGMGGALLLSPSGIGNLTYVRSLLTDKTVFFILEWAPRGIGVYLRELGWLWGIALGAILLVRRHLLFSLSIVLVFGLLSRQAFRHEMPFVFAAIAVTIEQLRWSGRWWQLTETMFRRPRIGIPLWVVAVLFAGTVAVMHARTLQRPLDLRGYGTFEPARGAYAFLERAKVRGRMFNTYDLGGYLAFRGYPERKIFIDGRNVDFGYRFLQEYARAAQDTATWQELEKRYDLTYAVLSHYLFADDADLPVFGHLETNPHWVLVYLDDWTAVYVKDIPEHRTLIERNRYALLRPSNLERGAILNALTSEQAPLLERELLRMMQESPESLEPRLVLARLYASAGLLRDASQVLREAMKQWPRRYEPVELLAAVYAAQQRWAEAAALYEEALARAGDAIEGVDYSALADIFEKAEDTVKAARYRARAEE